MTETFESPIGFVVTIQSGGLYARLEDGKLQQVDAKVDKRSKSIEIAYTGSISGTCSAACRAMCAACDKSAVRLVPVIGRVN